MSVNGIQNMPWQPLVPIRRNPVFTSLCYNAADHVTAWSQFEPTSKQAAARAQLGRRGRRARARNKPLSYDHGNTLTREFGLRYRRHLIVKTRPDQLKKNELEAADQPALRIRTFTDAPQMNSIICRSFSGVSLCAGPRFRGRWLARGLC